VTACTIAGLLDECAASRPTRPLLRDVAGTTLTVAEVAWAATYLAAAEAQPWIWLLPVAAGAGFVLTLVIFSLVVLARRG